MKNKRVVVSGGAGFIGSKIVERMFKDNEVMIIDDLSSGKIENLDGTFSNCNVKFLKASILDNELLEKMFRGVDVIFHHAAVPSVVRSINDPLATNEVNIKGTLNVLIAARNNKVKKVIFASSAAVYGNTTELPLKENILTDLQSPYALTKLAGEHYCHIFNNLYGLLTICLRYFNVYGPHQDINSEYSSVIPSFISKVLKNVPPVIFGDGNQTRDFVFVNDVVEANIAAAESDVTGVFNIGGGVGITINELAAKIITILGKDLRPKHEEPRTGEVRDSIADLTLSNSIGYRPKWSLEDGLRETIGYMQKLRLD